MASDREPIIEKGRISDHLDAPDLAIRVVSKKGFVEELDSDGDDPGEAPQTQYRLQARLVNRSGNKLTDIKYDVSYYAEDGTFLGLDRSRFLDEDELDVDDYLPIDMKLDIPWNTARCVFNARAKKAGLFGKLFWG